MQLISENGEFMITTTKSGGKIYMDILCSKHPLHHPLLYPLSLDVEWYKYTYGKYNYQPGYYNDHDNDCLKFAESLVLVKRSYRGENPAIFKEKKTGILFGEEIDEQITVDIAINNKNARQNNKANPLINQAYAISNLDFEVGKTPYHIALVLFKDGNTNITLEANACYDDMGFCDQMPHFYMYSSTPSKSLPTFHQRWSNEFGDNKTATMVLTPK